MEIYYYKETLVVKTRLDNTIKPLNDTGVMAEYQRKISQLTVFESGNINLHILVGDVMLQNLSVKRRYNSNFK